MDTLKPFLWGVVTTIFLGAVVYFVGNGSFFTLCNTFAPLPSDFSAPLDDGISSQGELSRGGEFVVVGVGPELSFQPTVAEDTLVMKRYTGDAVEYLFIEQSAQKGLATGDLLPGTTIAFSGQLHYLEGAAGSHYFRVERIDRFQKVKEPEQTEIQQLIDGYNYCESDSDCGAFYGDCPFDCHQVVNVKFLDISQQLIENYIERRLAAGAAQCMYGCVDIGTAKCEDYKCVLENV